MDYSMLFGGGGGGGSNPFDNFDTSGQGAGYNPVYTPSIRPAPVQKPSLPTSSAVRGAPEKLDLNSMFGFGNPGQGSGDPNLANATDLVSKAAAVPGRVMESPFSFLNVLSGAHQQQNATPGTGPFAKASFGMGSSGLFDDIAKGIGQVPVLGNLLSGVNTAIGEAGKVGPALVNAGDISRLISLRGVPDNTPLDKADPIAAMVNMTGNPIDTISSVIGNYEGIPFLSPKRTVGDFRAEMAKRGFTDANIQSVVDARQQGPVQAFQAETGFGDHPSNSNPLIALGQSVALDPTNLLFLGAGGAAARAAAGAAGTLLKPITAGIDLLPGMEKLGLATKAVPDAMTSAARIAQGDAAGMTMKGVGQWIASSLANPEKIIKGYAAGSTALSGGLVATDATTDFLAKGPLKGTAVEPFLNDLHDFSSQVLNDHPLSNGAAYNFFAAMHYPIRDVVGPVKDVVGKAIQDAKGGTGLLAEFKKTFGPDVLDRLGGEAGFLQLVGHIADKITAERIAPTIMRDFGSIDGAAQREAILHDFIHSERDRLLANGKISNSDIINKVKEWWGEQGGFAKTGVKQTWDPAAAIDHWQNTWVPIQQQYGTLAWQRSQAAVGLEGRLTQENIADLGKVLGSAAKDAEDKAVPLDLLRSIMQKYPQLVTTVPKFARFGVQDAVAPTWRWIRDALSEAKKTAPTADELTHELGTAEAHAPAAPTVPTGPMTDAGVAQTPGNRAMPPEFARDVVGQTPTPPEGMAGPKASQPPPPPPSGPAPRFHNVNERQAAFRDAIQRVRDEGIFYNPDLDVVQPVMSTKENMETVLQRMRHQEPVAGYITEDMPPTGEPGVPPGTQMPPASPKIFGNLSGFKGSIENHPLRDVAPLNGTEYAYHVTPATNFESIKANGLQPGKVRPGEPTGVYFGDNYVDLHGLAPSANQRNSIVLRTPRSGLDVTDMYGDSRLAGERVSRQPVAPENLEYLGSDGQWHGVSQMPPEAPGATETAANLEPHSEARIPTNADLEPLRAAQDTAQGMDPKVTLPLDREAENAVSQSGMDLSGGGPHASALDEFHAIDKELHAAHPGYRLKDSPKIATILREAEITNPQLATQLLRLNGLYESLRYTGPLSPLGNALSWIADHTVAPVANSDLREAQRQAVYNYALPRGATPGEINAIFHDIQDYMARHIMRVANTERPLFASSNEMLPSVLESFAKDHLSPDVYATIKKDFGGFTRLIDRSGNRVIQAAHGADNTLGRALEGWYGAYQNSVGKPLRYVRMFYPIFRFIASPRYWLMNAFEGNILGMVKYGTGIGDGKAELATVMHERGKLPNQQLVDEMSRVATVDDSGPMISGRKMAGFLHASFDSTRLESAQEVIDALPKTAPEFKYLVNRFGTDTRTWAEQLDQQLYNFDTKGVRASIEDEAAKTFSQSDNIALAPIKQRLYEVNENAYQAARHIFNGNNQRSNVERVLNNYFLYWPISYQLKAGKWLFDVMTQRAFGRKTNFGGAYTYAHLQNTNNQLIANDPEYAKMLKDNPDILFAAQMLFPITPGDIGVSLSRPVRYAGGMLGLWGAYKQASDPMSALKAILDLGPTYDIELLQRSLQNVQKDIGPAAKKQPTQQKPTVIHPAPIVSPTLAPTGAGG